MFRKTARYEEMPNVKAGVLNACGLLGSLLLLWFVAGELGWLNPSMLPSMQDVSLGLWQLLYPAADETLFNKTQVFRYFDFIDNFEATALRIALGCALGIPAGLILAAIAAVSTRLRPMFYLIAWVLHSVPKLLLLIPAAMLGIVGSKGAVSTGALAAFATTFITIYAGVSSIGLQDLVDEGRTLGLRRWQILLLIILPNPSVVMVFSTTLVLAISSAAGGVAVAELFSTSQGLGVLFRIALDNSELPKLVAIGACTIALIGSGPLLGGMYLFFSPYIWRGVNAVCYVLFCRVKNTAPPVL